MAGARVSYMGFTAGYQYGEQDSDADTSLITDDDAAFAATQSHDGWTHGFDLRYQTGPWHAQLEGMISEVESRVGDGQDEEQQTYKGALAYNLGPGVSLSGSVIYDDVDEDDLASHDEWAGIVGTTFSF